MGKKVNILNVDIDSLTMKEAIEQIEEYIHSGTFHMVVTANAEIVMMAQDDQEFDGILKQAAMVTADGAGVVWAARRIGEHLPERVAGCDLVQNLLSCAEKKGYSIYFLGGSPGVAEQAVMNVQERHPHLKVVGVKNGYFDTAGEIEILSDIRHQMPDILLVALGVPRQEKWLWKHVHDLPIPVCIGVGGTFDVLAGKVKRAPLWMQKSGLEWLYRLLSDPKRIIRMTALPRFVIRVFLAKKH